MIFPENPNQVCLSLGGVDNSADFYSTTKIKEKANEYAASRHHLSFQPQAKIAIDMAPEALHWVDH